MQIRTILRKGVDHQTFCEDFLYTFENDDLIIAATFDGCSDGVDSHFASALSGKCLRWVVKSMNDSHSFPLNIDDVFKEVLHQFLYKLNCMRITLLLPGEEILSTVILLVYDKKNDKGKIIALGDGVININGNLIIIDQNNEPDYPIVYAGAVTDSPRAFKEFFDNHQNKWDFSNLVDITISTDGLEQMKNKKDANLKFMDALDYFVNNKELSNLDVMLGRKYNILTFKGWQNHDDLGIVRIINETIVENEKTEQSDTTVHPEPVQN